MQHPIVTGRIHCTKFIKLFDCNNPKILSGLAAVDNDIPGMRYEFEACVAYLIPMDPVARNKVKADSKGRIVGAVATVLFGTKLKKGKGETGVELSFHKNRDFHQISQPQQDELFA